MAARNGHLKAVDFLVGDQVDLAIEMAIIGNQPRIVKHLIKRCKGKLDYFFKLAFDIKRFDLAEFFLANGVVLSECGNKLLEDSILNRDLERVQFLLNNKVKPGQLPTDVLRHIRDSDLLKMLIDHGLITVDEQITTILSTWSTSLNVLKLYLPYASKETKRIFLFVSMERGNRDFTKLLLKEDLDFHDSTKLIAQALVYQDIDVIRHLVHIGVKITDLRCLRLLMDCGDVDSVIKLVENGPDVTAENNAAISSAITNGSLPMIRMLLSLGSDPNIHFWEAVRTRNLDLIRSLLDYGADSNLYKGKAFEEAIVATEPEIIRLLLERGADANVNDGRMINIALRNGVVEILELLHKYGADFRLITYEALEYVASLNNRDAIKFLLSVGLTLTPRMKSNPIIVKIVNQFR